MPAAREYLKSDRKKKKSSKTARNWKVPAKIPKLPRHKQRRPGRGKEQGPALASSTAPSRLALTSTLAQLQRRVVHFLQEHSRRLAENRTAAPVLRWKDSLPTLRALIRRVLSRTQEA